MTGPAEQSKDEVASVGRLGARYHEIRYAADPIAATVDGVAGYDDELPDPSRAADERVLQDLEAIATELAEVDPAQLDGEDYLSHQTLAWLLRGAVKSRRHGLAEVGVSASVAGIFPGMVSVIPTASVATPSGAQAYLTRLAKLGEFFDRVGARQREAGRQGRTPTATGVRQAIAQLDGYLTRPPSDDPFLSPQPGDGVDAQRWRVRAGELVAEVVRPAIGGIGRRCARICCRSAGATTRSGSSTCPAEVMPTAQRWLRTRRRTSPRTRFTRRARRSSLSFGRSSPNAAVAPWARPTWPRFSGGYGTTLPCDFVTERTSSPR